MDAVAAVSTLSALAVFVSTVDHGRATAPDAFLTAAGAVRSVHGYSVSARGGRGGRWERWVEREFAFSASSCRELPSPVAAPRILPAEWRGRPAYREGLVVGAWRCILAFDSSSSSSAAAAVAPPPVLSPFMNPRVMCVPSLYNDLEKVFQFKNVEKVPELIQFDPEERLTRSAAQKKPSGGQVVASGSDSDEDPQSCEELPVPIQKQRRANKKHIASITLIDIAQYFHLPIREASSTLRIGVSILKKKCRQYGIPRWPHRKIKSLDSLIHDLEYVIDDTERDDVQQEKQKQKQRQRQKEEEERKKEKQDAILALTKRKRMLETEKDTIQQKPALDLMAETKLFREDVFKRRYRAKNVGSSSE